MSNPYQYLLLAGNWRVFFTLTWSGHVPSKCFRDASLERWLCWVAYRVQITRESLVFLFREEQGEAGGRFHFHGLLEVPDEWYGLFVVGKGRVSVAHRAWRRGRTSARRVDGAWDGACLYTVKDVSSSPEDTYEMKKYHYASTVYPSQKLQNRAYKRNFAPSVDGL